MKVSRRQLMKMLAWSALLHKNNVLIDPLTIDFRDSEAVVRAIDPTSVVLVAHNFKKGYFIDYEPIGKVQLPTASVFKSLRRHVKDDELELSVSGENLIIEGAKIEYRELLMSVEQREFPNIELTSTDFGLLPKQAVETMKACYSVDPSELLVDADVVKLRADAERELLVEFTHDNSSFKKKVPAMSGEVKEHHKVLLENSLLRPVLKHLDGVVSIVLTSGPVYVAQKTANYELLFAIAPRVEE